MQLHTLEIDTTTEARGLSACRMNRLGQLVVVVGQNGSGKSRLLKYAYESLQRDLIVYREPRSASDQIRDLDNQRIMRLSRLETAKQKHPAADGSGKASLLSQASDEAQQLRNIETQLRLVTLATEHLEHHYASPPQPETAAILLSLANLRYDTPRPLSIEIVQDPIEKTLQTINFGSTHSIEISTVIHYLAYAAFQSRHPDLSNRLGSRYLELWQTLQSMVHRLIGLRLDYEVTGVSSSPTLGGRKLNPTELSEGQRLLLGAVVALIAGVVQSDESVSAPPRLPGSIIFVDEPECHLHPAAATEFVRELIERVGPTGQVWLATHSVSLLSQLSPDQIWTMERGQLHAPSSNQAARALELLVGGEESIQRLAEFTTTPAKMALLSFASQCLCPPSVAAHRSEDPQMHTVAESFLPSGNHSRVGRILDCGAGKGRLAKALSETFPTAREIEYVAVEPDAHHHDSIRSNASLVNLLHIAKSVSELPTHYDSSFDVVILCNVLHEVRPTKWCSLFRDIEKRLRPGGELLLCEDTQMPTGERPTDLGFLLLEEKHFHTLFGTTSLIRLSHPSPKYAHRLLFLKIPKNCLSITMASVRSAIEDLERSTWARIEELRTAPLTTAKDGREYSLRSQIAINCKLALVELS